MKNNDQNTNAFLIHISSFAGFLFPLGSIITPLILWQTLKERSRFLDEQGKEAVNFNISYALYIFILGISFIPVFFGTFFNDAHHLDFGFDIDNGLLSVLGIISLASIVGFIKIALVIIAAIKSKEGENYTYPFTIKFIK